MTKTSENLLISYVLNIGEFEFGICFVLRIWDLGFDKA